jgi:hypothetical protein
MDLAFHLLDPIASGFVLAEGELGRLADGAGLIKLLHGFTCAGTGQMDLLLCGVTFRGVFFGCTTTTNEHNGCTNGCAVRKSKKLKSKKIR